MKDRMPRFLAQVGALLGTTLSLAGQSAPDIEQERVREIVSFLADDELAGRDTPSPGLEKAADWIGRRFAAAGLEPVRSDDFFHRYELPGQVLDSTTVRVTLHADDLPDLELVPDVDVRLLRSGERLSGERAAATLVQAGDPRVGRILMVRGAPRVLFVVVDEDDSSWQQASGRRTELAGRRQGARPVFLVRQAVLPAAEEERSHQVTYEIPEVTTPPIPLRNVVGVLRGGKLPGEYVVVSAHYDHLGVGRAVDGDAIYNGADDNATGTTAVVALAESLAAGPRPARSVLFVCFSGEEKGLRGSRAFAESPPVELEDVVANVNIEMIGRPPAGAERQAWITGAQLSDFSAVVAPALERAGIRLTDYEHAGRLFAASDNLSLALKGVVAHSISAGSLHEDYHRPSDELDKLDLAHVTAVIRGLREAVLELANRDERPAYNAAGRAYLERLRR